MGRSMFWMAALLGAAIAVPYAADKWTKLKGGSGEKQTDNLFAAKSPSATPFADSGRATSRASRAVQVPRQPTCRWWTWTRHFAST